MNQHTVVSGIRCPKCERFSVSCEYRDTGGTGNFYDEFHHQCSAPGCDYREHWEHPGGDAGWESDWPSCPFCGRDCLATENGGISPANNPIEAEWLAWRNGCIVSLARSIAEERSFDVLPVLA